MQNVNQKAIKNFLVQDFFFTDNTRTKYDLNKITLFNILYCGGRDEDKACFLFKLMQSSEQKKSPKKQMLMSQSSKLLQVLDYSDLHCW